MDIVQEDNDLLTNVVPTPEEDSVLDTQLANTSLEDLIDDLSKAEYITDTLDEELTDGDVNPALESLGRVIEGIRRSGGISRSDAQTLKQMTASMEGFEHTFDEMPINSFTELPSKVNFQPAMEGVLSTIGRKVVEFIRAIVKWIREKATAFVNWVRGVRTNVKKTDEAAKKTDEALKKSSEAMGKFDLSEMMAAHNARMNELNAAYNATVERNRQQTENLKKASEERSKRFSEDLKRSSDSLSETLDALDKHFGRKPGSNWAKGAAERQAGKQKFQLDLPIIAYMPSTKGAFRASSMSNIFSYIESVIVLAISKPSNTSSYNAGFLNQLAILIDSDIEISKTMNTAEFFAALRSLAVEYNKKASDVDILTVTDPEGEMRRVIAMMREWELSKVSDKSISKLVNVTDVAKKRAETIEKEIAREANLVDKDPRVVEADLLRKAIQAINDTSVIFGYIAKAYNEVVAEGARLSNNPGRAKAA